MQDCIKIDFFNKKSSQTLRKNTTSIPRIAIIILILSSTPNIISATC